jgi:hypothetical protein
MSRLRQSTVAAGAIALLVCSCSTPTSKDQLTSKAMQLQRAQFIEFAISHRETGSGTFCSQSIYDPIVLGKVRSWIRQHAWPPIDPNETGAVAPRGSFRGRLNSVDRLSNLCIRFHQSCAAKECPCFQRGLANTHYVDFRHPMTTFQRQTPNKPAPGQHRLRLSVEFGRRWPGVPERVRRNHSVDGRLRWSEHGSDEYRAD